MHFARGHSAPMAWQVKQGKGWLCVNRQAAKAAKRNKRKPHDLVPRSGWLSYVGEERKYLSC